MATEFEITARWKKSVAFASYLWSHGILSGELDRISAVEWASIAALIGHNPPSGPETVTAIRFVMAAFESSAAARVEEQQKKEQDVKTSS